MRTNPVAEVRRFLARVRRRWVTAAWMRATAQGAGVCLGLLLSVLAVDRFLRPPDAVLVVLATGGLLAAAGHTVWTAWSARRRPSDAQVARLVEERCPELEDRLTSATEIASRSAGSPLGDLMVADAAGHLSTVTPDRVVGRRSVRRAVGRGVVVTVVLLGVLWVGREPVARIARTTWLYAVPYTATLVVEPGSTRVVAGQALEVRARIDGSVGAPSRTWPTLTITDARGQVERVTMGVSDEAFRALIPSVDRDFTYRVTVATLTSEEYDVAALFAPRVERIDISYEYPSYADLPVRVEEDSGDVYAPVGTRVTVTVHADTPVREAELVLDAGGRLPLGPVTSSTREISFDVVADDTYRVHLVSADGLTGGREAEYYIRTVVDQPPRLDITRPLGDRQVTALEEVVLEARAVDDLGLERFQFVYNVVGRDERIVNALDAGRARRAVGTHTIYLENLDVQPGDFLTFYARARDTNPGPEGGDVRTDIYFLEVRPFGLEFEEAQSQSAAGMEAGELGNLAKVQKEIIVATWRLDQQDPATRPATDLTTVADAQEELRWAVQRLSEQIRGRGRTVSPQTLGRPQPEGQAMRDAIEAMTEAAALLRQVRTTAAIPHEMEALQHLLRAEAEVRRRQVSTRPNDDGGQGGGNQAQEDISALFDQDLRRDQETNYEERASSTPPADTDESETQRRLAELARRQEELTRQQERLAERAEPLAAEERRRRLERLTREQEELRHQLEELARRVEGEQSGSGQSDPDLTRVSDQMRQALSDLRRGATVDAARSAREAAEALDELQRRRGGRAAENAPLRELRREAEALVDAQEQMASGLRRVDETEPDVWPELADQGARLADRVEGLEERLESAGRELPGDPEAHEAVEASAQELRQEGVARRNRDLAEEIRRRASREAAGTTPGQPAPEGEPAELADLAEAGDEIAGVLARVAGRLASVGDPSDADDLSTSLEAARALREALDELGGRLAQLAASGSTEPDDEPATQSEPSGEDTSGRELAALGERLAEQLAESPGVLEHLSRARPTAQADLERWARHWQSSPSPGTEAFKQDFSAWESLRTEVRVALEAYEADRVRERRERETGDRHRVGASDQLPEEYRRVVERYFRSIATEPPRR